MKKKLLYLAAALILLLSSLAVKFLPEPEAERPYSGEGLTVHFIDVGQADCALLECDGEYMLIDGGNVEDSRLVVAYLQQLGVQQLDTIICSHAHEDHVGGLPAVLAVYPTQTILAPTKTYSSQVFDDFLHYADQQRVEVTIPSPGDVYSLGDDKTGAAVTVLGPVKSYAETNDTSIVVRVDYGANSFLFTGDMEVAAENDMLEHWEGRTDWKVDVLKVGHHGSDTSTGYRFLYETEPAYGVISVGTGNSYGHPQENILSRLEDAGVTLLRTDRLGTILAHADGREITFTWENGKAQPDYVQSAAEICFYGNIKSRKFHLTDCSSLPAEGNRVIFGSYAEATAAGYLPCGSCLGG